MRTFLTLLTLIILTVEISSQWNLVTGTSGLEIRSIVISSNNIYVGTGGRGVFVSTNSGQTWRENAVAPSAIYVRDLAIDGNNLFAGTDGGVFISTDQGNTWTPKNTGITSLNILDIEVSGNNIFAVGDGGVYHSINSGNNWTQMNNGIDNSTLKAVAIGSNIVYVGGGGGIYTSNNNGLSWNKINTYTLWGTWVNALTLDDNLLYAGTWQKGIYVSNDSGTSWSAINSNMSTTMIESIIPISDNIFAATWGQGIYLSTNNGSSWNLINTGLPHNFFNSIAFSSTHIYCGSSAGFDGLMSRPLSELITGVENSENENLPTAFYLHQNYPNPFNPNTVISYQLPVGSNVSLKIYDMFGREVATPLNEFRQAGTHNLKLNIQNYSLSSGVYFYKLIAGGFSETKKMIYLK